MTTTSYNILLETGDDLLLEDGVFVLLLEAQALLYPSITPTESMIDFTANTTAFISPMNGATQTIDYGGGGFTFNLVHKNLKGDDRANMMDFAVGLDGQLNTVLINNHAENQRGAFGGTPLVTGDGQSGTSINIDGCSLSVTNWIREGDWFGVNGELKICTADANSDGSGLCTISFAPPLRKSPSDNTPITTSAATGTFRLAQNSVNWTNKPGGFSDFSFSFIEDVTS